MQIKQLGQGLRQSGSGLWSCFALGIAAFVIAPIVAVVWLALHPTENIWPHLLSTTLPRYFGNSAILAGGVGLLTAVVGAATAWLVSMYRFPGARWLDWALLMPLAIPAYVGAYALVDFLDYAGPVQIFLRDSFGWADARSYWFPQIRSRWAAILVLGFAFYPYTYLLARAAFREQSGASYEVARALGSGGFALFWKVGLPLARPAIAAGAAIAMMETVADFGVVDYFGVQTLTTGIFTTWLEAGNTGGAAQIATVILMIIFALFALEKISRRNSRYYQSARHARPVIAQRLTGWAGVGACVICLIPLLAGFVLPVAVIMSHALANPDAWFGPGLGRALWHSIVTGAAASVICVAAGLVMVYGVRLSGRRLPRLVLPLTTLGYAAPGAVLAVGILIPLAAFDNRLADLILALTGYDPGLMLTGTGAAIVFAYVVRFFAIAQGAADSAFGRVSPSLPMAARSLGRSNGGVLGSVYLPLMRGSVGSALLLVFVECVKELPATMLLRPFNYETLATRVHDQASLENLGDASPPALLVCALGLLAVAVLARTLARRS
ncbi:iron ABC transporter permease [Thioclava sp. SK-1]|uniref:ABC transporter permease n=1 Tax=Thioclava sp. SK-1 TaxID=1889770 RepID=UPI000825BB52|nr:iron ABC transporter permease [Thioclava sp. SK-1]OCX61020.1 iron ABC transporter permease [Thioclava sp. SK-1]